MRKNKLVAFFQFAFWAIVYYVNHPRFIFIRLKKILKNKFSKKSVIYSEKMYPGSSDNKKLFYHNVPFAGEIIHFIRDNSPERLNILLMNQDFKNKRVLDLGCNIGFFAFSIANQAREVIGVDYDQVAINKAKELSKKYNVKNVRFISKEITENLLKDLGHFDVVLCLSVLPWLKKADKNHLEIWKAIFSNKIVYSELMYKHDGPAGMDDIGNDEDAYTYLKKFSKIVHPIGWTQGWGDRTIWRSVNDFGKFKEYDGHSFSKVFLSEQFVKKSRDGFYNHSLRKEYLALDRLKKERISPIPVEITENYLITARLRGNQFDLSYPRDKAKQQFKRIIKILKDNKIVHRDITPENLFVGVDGSIYLLDFGWAVVDNEWYDVPKTLEALNRVKKFDNEESFEIILEKLRN